MGQLQQWCVGVRPASAQLVVGDATHEILWRRGSLVLVDHPDPAADLALAALGGKRCLCLDVRDAWQHDRGRLLVSETTEPLKWRAHLRRLLDLRDRHQDMLRRFASAEPMVPIGIRFRLYAEIGAPIGSTHPEVYEKFAERLTDEFNSEVLRSLPSPLFDVLVASRSVHAARNEPSPLKRWSNLDATNHRVRRSVERWLGANAPRTIEARLDAGPPNCKINNLFDTSGGSLEFVVPSTWLVDVWARGLAVAGDKFILAAGIVHRADHIDVTTCELLDGRSGILPVISEAAAHRQHDGTWTLTNQRQ